MEPSVILLIVPTQLPLTGSSGIMPHEKLSLKRPSSARGESAGKYGVNYLLILLNFKWNLASGVYAKCCSYPQGENESSHETR